MNQIGTPTISFRSGDLLEPLAARTPEVPAEESMPERLTRTARRDLERYYAAISALLASLDFSPEEAAVIAQATAQVAWTDTQVRTLPEQVRRGMQTGRLDQAWGVNGPSLISLLETLTLADRYAVVDALERLWLSYRHDRPISKQLITVGLLKAR
jgi:hypothetical protein